jgi:hypothetical protein
MPEASAFFVHTRSQRSAGLYELLLCRIEGVDNSSS